MVSRTGSICEESLTHSGWVSGTQLLELLIRVKALLLEGGARIDFQSGVGSSYGEMEARQAYFRVAQQHGWQT